MSGHEFDVEYKFGRIFRKRMRRWRSVCTCGWTSRWWVPDYFGLSEKGDTYHARAEFDLHIWSLELKERGL